MQKNQHNLEEIIRIGELFVDPNNFIQAAIRNKKEFKKRLKENGIDVPRFNDSADEFMSKILRALWETLVQ